MDAFFHDEVRQLVKKQYKKTSTVLPLMLSCTPPGRRLASTDRMPAGRPVVRTEYMRELPTHQMWLLRPDGTSSGSSSTVTQRSCSPLSQRSQQEARVTKIR